MKVFTYKNYIKCIHTLRLNAIFQLAEENANYNIFAKINSKTQQTKQISNNLDKMISKLFISVEKIYK